MGDTGTVSTRRSFIPNRFQIETISWRERLRLGEPDASFFSLSSQKEERVGERRQFGSPPCGSLPARASRGEKGTWLRPPVRNQFHLDRALELGRDRSRH